MTKTLMLAAVTALSLGFGTAMAQNYVPGASGANQAHAVTAAPAQSPATQTTAPQAGSSDVEQRTPSYPILLGGDGGAA